MAVLRRAALCAAALVLAGASPAGAATFTVTKTIDSLDGACNADCSLREAVQAANADATQDTIVLPAGQVQLTLGGAPEDLNASGDLDVANDVVLRGAGADRTVVRGLFFGGQEDRILDLAGSNTDAELHGLTVTGGFTHEGIAVGGGIRAIKVRSLLLDHVVLRANRAEGQAAAGDGGNLAFVGNSGALTIRDSALLDGRGAYTGFGGALYSDAVTAPMTIENTTFAGNSTAFDGQGGAIFFNNQVDATLTHVTIVGNKVDGTGVAGIGGDASGVRLRSSIVAGNTQGNGAATDCGATYAPASDGGNVGAPNCGLTLPSDIAVPDPRLAPLSGDAIPVLAPLAGSPALDHAIGPCPATDARDLPRPSGPACDSGAAELQVPAPATPPVPSPQPITQADTTAPRLTLPKTLFVDRLRRRAALRLRCPSTETRCTGTVRLTRTVRVKGGRRTVVLARSPFAAEGRQTATIMLKLGPAARAAIKGGRRAEVTLAVTVVDASGNRRSQSALATLTPRRV